MIAQSFYSNFYYIIKSSLYTFLKRVMQQQFPSFIHSRKKNFTMKELKSIINFVKYQETIVTHLKLFVLLIT